MSIVGEKYCNKPNRCKNFVLISGDQYEYCAKLDDYLATCEDSGLSLRLKKCIKKNLKIDDEQPVSIRDDKTKEINSDRQNKPLNLTPAAGPWCPIETLPKESKSSIEILLFGYGDGVHFAKICMNRPCQVFFSGITVNPYQFPIQNDLNLWTHEAVVEKFTSWARVNAPSRRM